LADFLQDPGTGGFIVTPFDLLTTELSSLANGNTAVSSVGGASGVFAQSDTGSAVLGAAWFESGGTFTPSAGGFLAVWFLRSSDGGTTFEKTVSNTAMPRSPDMIIPLFNSAYASGAISWAQDPELRLPFESFKVLIQNQTGVTLPSSGNKITLGPVAIVRS
jgi:hypothetical protein